PQAVAGLTPLPMRLRVLRLGETTLIDDCYNANPQSVRVALEVLRQSAAPELRVAFLGDMLELGDAAEAQHERLGQEVGVIVNRLAVVGPLGEFTARGAEAAGLTQVRRFASSVEARDALFDIIRPQDTILVKGSRAMAMELVSQEIVRRHEKRD
ncbi:UDP-N-acetylmuramoyl-tripeptide--D-alanyl-D-alanine ligase, partial [candidate division WOR-3 bacterium]|nr:UDP-N-acetylmuramoyl-tripeptide--D-alanyl-D-alanine ligase [candidate division WOR-3 bacterium]